MPLVPSPLMFIYQLTVPVDFFDSLTPLADWIGIDPCGRMQWALEAVLALADAGSAAGWEGDMRYLPSVGSVIIGTESVPFLVVKQDNNGTTFVISASSLAWHPGEIHHGTEVSARSIGGRYHP